MNCAALGRDIAQVICEMAKLYGSQAIQATSAPPDNTEWDLLLFLSSMAYIKVTMESALSKDAAEQVTYTMERTLEATLFPGEDIGGDFFALLTNRYEGYMKAMTDNSNPGGPGFNTAKYFAACCRQGPRSVDYERLIPDPDDLEKLGETVNLEALRQMRDLNARGENATYPLGMEVIQISGLLGSYVSALHHGIDSLIQRHS